MFVWNIKFLHKVFTRVILINCHFLLKIKNEKYRFPVRFLPNIVILKQKTDYFFKFSFETYHKTFSLGSVSAKNFYFWIKIDKYKNICTFLTYGVPLNDSFLLLLFRYFLLNKCLPVRIWFQKRRRAAEKVSFWSHFSFLRFQNHVTVVLFSEFIIYRGVWRKYNYFMPEYRCKVSNTFFC